MKYYKKNGFLVSLINFKVSDGTFLKFNIFQYNSKNVLSWFES